MKKAILGKKLGMTQIFKEDGTVVPVTVIQAGPCTSWRWVEHGGTDKKSHPRFLRRGPG